MNTINFSNLPQASKINLLGCSVIALAAGTGLLAWKEYSNHKQQQEQQDKQHLEFEQKLAVLEKQQQEHYKMLVKQGKTVELSTTEIQKIKLLQQQHKKQLRKLSQGYYAKANHNKMVVKFKGIPAVKLYKVQPRQVSDKEKLCLSKNIWHEAAFEPVYGRLAVAQVTGNRLASKVGGNTFCKVVYKKAAFSWTLDKKLVNQQPTGQSWIEAQAIADMYLQGYRIKGLEKTEFYYAKYIKEPYWASGMKYRHYIGEHLFLEEV